MQNTREITFNCKEMNMFFFSRSFFFYQFPQTLHIRPVLWASVQIWAKNKKKWSFFADVNTPKKTLERIENSNRVWLTNWKLATATKNFQHKKDHSIINFLHFEKMNFFKVIFNCIFFMCVRFFRIFECHKIESESFSIKSFELECGVHVCFVNRIDWCFIYWYFFGSFRQFRDGENHKSNWKWFHQIAHRFRKRKQFTWSHKQNDEEELCRLSNPSKLTALCQWRRSFSTFAFSSHFKCTEQCFSFEMFFFFM